MGMPVVVIDAGWPDDLVAVCSRQFAEGLKTALLRARELDERTGG